MGFHFETFENEKDLHEIVNLIESDLSEPYSIFTYRYFVHQWREHCHICRSDDGKLIGVIICKLEIHRGKSNRGYIAMLAVHANYRKLGIGSKLVQIAVDRMKENRADEVVLETETSNRSAMRLYENLGFIREKLLERYYLNGEDAFRLKLFLSPLQIN